MPFDDQQRRLAIAKAYNHWQVWTFCKYDFDRMGKLVDITSKACDEAKASGIVMGGESLQNFCLARVQSDPEYKDTVSFIPLWLLVSIAEIIIKIIIEYWTMLQLEKQMDSA